MQTTQTALVSHGNRVSRKSGLIGTNISATLATPRDPGFARLLNKNCDVRRVFRRAARARAGLAGFFPFDCLLDEFPGMRRIAPVADLHPLAGLEILVMFEKVLDSLQVDIGQVRVVMDVIEALRHGVRRHSENLLVLTRVVLHHEDPDRPDVDHAAGRRSLGACLNRRRNRAYTCASDSIRGYCQGL